MRPTCSDRRCILGYALLAPILVSAPLAAQEYPTLAPLLVQAQRIDTHWQDLPTTLSLIDAEDLGTGRTQLHPSDALAFAPGVLLQNRDNFAQNPRVSIRGFGARAPFGVRGIRVRMDGIPLSSVDGQAQLDGINSHNISRIEVMRSANAVLHGNGSGGLLDYSSHRGAEAGRQQLSLQTGGHGLRSLHAAVGEEGPQSRGRGALAHLEQQGYRQQSAVSRRHAGLWLDRRHNGSEMFVTLHQLDNPIAQDPGGLTRAEWKSNPRQAAPLALQMDAGQRVNQQIASLGLTHPLGQGQQHRVHGQAWWITRDFHQQLPFPGDSLVSYQRQLAGGTLEYQRPLGKLHLYLGLDTAWQEDDRQRFCRNTLAQPYLCRPGLDSDLALDQLETARNTGLALQLAAATDTGRWQLGLRHDWLQLAIADQLQTNGIDRSDERRYRETHYSLGYSHPLTQRWNLFGQLATSFEAPTFTEFANPAGSGFRPDLAPQHSRSLELGLRGGSDPLIVEATLFMVRTRDEIIIDDAPGALPDDQRVFYRNADQTRRDGLELGTRWWPQALPGLQLSGAFTLMDARFEHSDTKHLPGLPKQFAFVDAHWFFGDGYFFGLDTHYHGKRYADDANTVRVASQHLSQLRLGREITHGQQHITWTFGIENLFNQPQLSNLRINDRNQRYYEPGAERRFYLSLALVLG